MLVIRGADNIHSVGLSWRKQSPGFALIASLLLLVLLSGVAIGLMMMVNTEGRVGNHDIQNSLAYRSAEGAIEKMTADLANKFQSIQSPTATDITSLGSLVPTTDPNVSYPVYSLVPATNPDGSLQSSFGQIRTGPYQGLYAQIIPVTLNVTAQRALGDEVSMTRTVEEALIPVFQFGVFSESDLAFFNSPNLDFQGRVHTNGDLYLGVFSGYTITFHDKLTAYGNVIRQTLPNGLSAAAYSDTGTVDILTASQGCDGTKPACRRMAATEGSVVSGPTSAYNSGPPSWQTISLGSGYYNGWIVDGNWNKPGGTGAGNLSLPFVGGSAQPYQIIRRPPAGESPSSVLGGSRLYNQAEIRILLSDDPAELPGGAGDPNNIRLANVSTPGGPNYSNGVPASVPSTLPALASGKPYTTYFAEATNSSSVADTTTWASCMSTPSLPPDWPGFPLTPPAGDDTLVPLGTAPIISSGTPTTWNLLDGYLRVEVRQSSGTYVPVTQEWLQLGFARGLTPPKAGSPNPINPNAILLLQEPADRNGNGVIDGAAPGGSCSRSQYSVARPAELATDTNSNSMYYGDGAQPASVTRNNWYPINFYDAREGEVRDTVQSGCTPNGVMDAVEIDVGNLKKWLAGTIPGSGTSVDYNVENGYILYFSDRRGMLPNPNASNLKTGDSGLEDSINSANTSGTPDGKLEPIPAGKTQSPEDVNNNGVLDNFGGATLGDGFNINTNTNPPNPYLRMANCMTTGRKNWVSGARHVLKLVDGSLGNLPVKPDGTGGFTVASENPVYIQGDYNSSSADPTWTNPSAAEPAHAASSVIADAVTVLSNNWSDLTSLQYPTGASGHRSAVSTYYRTAIAAGKNINFPAPSYTQTGTLYGFGTDGGLHNFLRFLEDWTGDTLYYKGSLVSLFYSTYATGTFKCCGDAVYHPPTRNYVFDPLFAQPQNLPPGTPMFRDVDNLSSRQNFTARTN